MAYKYRNKWRVQWYERGRRKSKLFPNKALAIKFEAKLTMEMVDPVQKAADQGKITFAEYAEKWVRDYCRLEKAETQWRGDESAIRHHLLPAFGHIKLKDLTKRDLEELKQGLRRKTVGTSARPLRSKTINNVLVLAKKMLATSVDWELLVASPFAGVKPLRVATQPFDFWKLDERDHFIRFARQIDPDFTKAVIIACHTGMRLGELAGLKRGSIDYERRMIRVQNSYNNKLKKHLLYTKNRDIADIPMNEEVYRTLIDQKMLNPDSLIFPIDLLSNPTKRLQSLCRRIGGRPLRFHDLRHTFASCLAMAGVDLRTIQELMRHKSISMTLRYTHLHPDYLKGATEILCGTQTAHKAQKSLEAVTSRLI